MALPRPKTTLKLVLYGFGFVAIPLIFALGYAALYVNRLADQSQHAVYSAVRAVEDSRMLMEQLTSMDRAARQYLILGDKSLLKAYEDTHQHFKETASNLTQLPLDPDHREKVDTLVTAEARLYTRITKHEKPGKSNTDKIATAFMKLNDAARAVQAASNSLIERQVNIMQHTAETAQRILFWFGVALIPLTLLSTIIFTILIARPIRQVDMAIRDLGAGQFDKTIRVSGPEDLQYLGERLDWLRRRLLELEDQKTRFLRHVSHELKTPLTAIREGGDLLSEKAVGPLNVTQAEIMQIVQDNARRLQRLIEDLLNFSTTQNNNAMVSPASFRVDDLIRETVQNHKPALLSKNIALETDIATVSVVADRDKIGTVMDNLLSNAIKFTPPEGRIRIQLAESEGRCNIDITDTGPGIGPEDADRVFEAFYQGSAPARGYVKGSGLGLSIAREYLVAHSGHISILGNEDTGAHLRVSLPLNGKQETT